MRFTSTSFLCLFLCLSWPTGVRCAEPVLEAKDLPRVPPTEATNALGTIKVKNGFKVEIAAAEPLVVDPIAMSFDENGRLFVVEMRDYSEMRNVQPHLGRIRMLEDTNGDGVFDKATIYADDLPWPTGVMCYGGGIFVAASPDILFLKDTDGDGKADTRKVVFTGFGASKGDKLNVQALVNSFNWGLDNRIHVQNGGNGGLIVRGNQTNAAPLELNGRDFWFDPRTLEMGAETGGGQYGMCFDNEGRRFVCSNSHHIQTFMYDAHYADRNPHYNMPPALVDIPVDGPAAEVYRISPEEQWRVIRTKWRVTGVVPGLIEGGGRASGYFTSATGIVVVRGDAWPESMLGDAFVADCGSNLVHRKKVRHEGAALVAERPPDEQKVEFLASRDIWFRPVMLANGPDGALYIADMYREVIEHPWSLPESIKRLLDLNAGNDRGRIYRLAPADFTTRKPPRLGSATLLELVTTLEHPNGWHRDAAARLLYERSDLAAVPMLEKLLSTSSRPLARMHALYVLEGLGALKEEHILHGLTDADPRVRRHAIVLSEKLIRGGKVPPEVFSKLKALAEDPDVQVRFQLALTLGEIHGKDKIAPLGRIAARDINDAWVQAAVLSSLREGAGDVFQALAAESSLAASGPGQDLLRQLLILIGAQNDGDEVKRAVAFIKQQTAPGLKFQFMYGLGQGLQAAKTSIAALPGGETGIFREAAAAVSNSKLSATDRIGAIRLLGLGSFDLAGEPCLRLLNENEAPDLQLAAMDTLGRFADAKIAPALVKLWPALTPRLRAQALLVLLARAERAEALLRAIQSGSIRASDLDTTQQKFLAEHPSGTVRELAKTVLAKPPTGSRQEIIDSFLPALALRGDTARGRKIYQERCLSCHRRSGEGYALGPDFVTVKNTGKEKLLTNIVDPNREVRPEFVGYVVETSDDESYLGLITRETGTTVTVRQAYGKEDILLRVNIRKTRSQGKSLMPEGLEMGLSQQDMADLLECVETSENP